MLEPDTRGRSRGFGFTFEELQSHPSLCSQCVITAVTNTFAILFFAIYTFAILLYTLYIKNMSVKSYQVVLLPPSGQKTFFSLK